MEQEEIWRDIEGYEGLYRVSNMGRVKSLKYGKEKILRLGMNMYGYLQIVLCKEGERENFLVHRLVGQSFIPNPEGLPQINHKDEDKTNNVVFLKDDGSVDKCRSNLEWCDRKYNNTYGTRIERMVQTRISNGLADPELCSIDEREYQLEYQQKNRDKKNEYQREWYQKNQDKWKEYYQENREKIREYQQEYQRKYRLKRKQEKKKGNRPSEPSLF